MCIQSDRPIKKVELADILSQHADAYIASHGVSSIQRKAINSISHCRTAALGGHVLRCDHCGKLEIAYTRSSSFLWHLWSFLGSTSVLL